MPQGAGGAVGVEHAQAEAIGLLARMLRHDLINATFAGRSLCARLRDPATSPEQAAAGFEMLVEWLENMQASLEPLVQRDDQDPAPADLKAWWESTGQLVARMLPFGSETSGRFPAGLWLVDARRLTRALTLFVLRLRGAPGPVAFAAAAEPSAPDALPDAPPDAADLVIRLSGAPASTTLTDGERALLAAALGAGPEAVRVEPSPEEALLRIVVPLRPAPAPTPTLTPAPADAAHEKQRA